MKKPLLILIGGGGHCKVIISVLNKLKCFKIIGIVDNNSVGNSVEGVKVIGTDENLEYFRKKGITHALITIGSIRNNTKRLELFKISEKLRFKFPVIVSPEAIVDKTVEVGDGTVIMPGCVVNIDTTIGKNTIINTGAQVDHDCRIGDHCHIAPGAHISGGVEIGDLSFIGIGSTIIQGVRIGKNVIVGAGSVIIKDIPDNAVIVGNPGKRIK
ncbi:MAG: acetyltransferase [Candidatus Marinimicrobia bacterium]|nr:acetyltransferase [Candidatus Neomarinimicrobiota bacterium]